MSPDLSPATSPVLSPAPSAGPSPEPSAAALTIADLHIDYRNGVRAVTDFNLTVERGQSVGIVGASGSGKTTVLRAILGLLPEGTRVRGAIRVDGRNLMGMSARELRTTRGKVLGYVSQDPFSACDPLRTVSHHVEEAWTAHGERAPRGFIAQGLGAMGIDDAARRMRQRPHQWSGGMLQRATTLAATVHDPVLTLADEPTSALDAELADEAIGLLRDTCAALLVVTHDLALAARHTDRVIVLHEGLIVEHGDSTAVLERPTSPFARALVAAARPPARAPAPPVAGAVVLRAEDVSKSYEVRGGGTVRAVRPTTLELRAGEVLGILGPSGSGKSTLLRLLAGMERPDTGTLTAGGGTVWGTGRAPRLPRRGFVMPVFQDPVASLDPRWPLWRTITEPLVLAGRRLSTEERRQVARTELDAVGMGDVDLSRLPGSLSGGQCQRVAFVRALVAGPAVIAADEPTASLDVEMAAVVGDLVRTAADKGAAVVVVSHDEVRLRSFADRLLRVASGVVTQID